MTTHAGAIPDWACAHGGALLAAVIRRSPDDFRVTEELGFEPSDDGEHDFLWIEKTAANTAWVARQLARHAGIASRDVGYAGLKDRHAVTQQWFSVRRPQRSGINWEAFAAEGVRILGCRRNARKLRRGAHVANEFRIALRAAGIDEHAVVLRDRIARISQFGVPNYFGPQRFGRDGGNLELAKTLFTGARLARDSRSYALSAARSYLFNAILDKRVRDGTWNRLLIGDLANLDGSGSVFPITALTQQLIERCDELDIHPSGTLWGQGAPLTSSIAAESEATALAADVHLCDGLTGAGIDASSRALRLRVADVEVEFDADTLWLNFRLGRGAFATAVIREVADCAA